MLDINAKQNTRYAVDLFVRDENIKLAIKRVKERVTPYEGLREEPCAVVGFGPSLRDTWEDISQFHYIFSCSGSHKFLIEHGVIPSHHCDVDPRSHKVGLMGQPHPDVEYLIASACSPKLFDHLEGYKVKLWHIFDNAEESIRTLPQGEWSLTGGIDAGLRAMTLARFLGFTDVHLFGMDASSPEQGYRHAGSHPHTKMTLEPVEYEGRTFLTTAGMLAAAQGIWHELNQLHDVSPTFHGDGLIQHMSKFYERKEKKGSAIAFRKPELISPEYRELNARLHKDNVAFGVGGGKYADAVIKLKNAIQAESILDYGCGKSYLQKALGFPIWQYDPAIPEFCESPRPADLVIASDVLEHIESEKLLLVLDDLRRVTKKIGYFIISTVPAQKILADGRNTHLLVYGQNWWSTKLSKFFIIGRIWMVGTNLHVIVAPKSMKKK